MYTSLLFTLAPAIALAAPLIQQQNPIPGRYIVKMQGNSQTMVASAMASLATPPEHEYFFGGFTGFAGSLSYTDLTRLQASSSVSWCGDICGPHNLIRTMR